MIKAIRLFSTCLLLALGASASAQRVFDINLWAGNAPNDNGDKADTAKVRVYLADERKATGRAVIVMPGGGYESLSMGHEGIDWAPFLNNLGITAVVLKYRMPHGNPQVPVSDAEEAMRLVRKNAATWHINPNDVGVMGFSAGGHLASVIATKSAAAVRPNFQMLFYPVITMMPGYTHGGSHDNFLGREAKKKDEREYSTDAQVSRTTPRALIVVSDNDHAVAPANSVNYYMELYRHDVPASLFVYPKGGHGYGISPSFAYHSEMLLNVKAWLESF